MGRRIFSQTETVAFFIGSINFQDAKMMLVNRAELAHSAKMSHFTASHYSKSLIFGQNSIVTKKLKNLEQLDILRQNIFIQKNLQIESRSNFGTKFKVAYNKLSLVFGEKKITLLRDLF